MGYINKLDDHTIVPDPERFHIIRKMGFGADRRVFHRVIRTKANGEWNFRSQTRRRWEADFKKRSTIYFVTIFTTVSSRDAKEPHGVIPAPMSE